MPQYSIQQLHTLLAKDDKEAREFTETFDFKMGLPDVGWIDVELHLGQQKFDLLFSDVYPPILDMIYWLEKHIKSKQAEPFYFNDEADDHYFHLTHTGQNTCFFEYIRPFWYGGGLHTRVHVNFLDVVKAFLKQLEIFAAIDFEAEQEKEEGTRIRFSCYSRSDDIAVLDLSILRDFVLKSE